MSDMMDLSEVVNDGVLAESYTILRSTGSFQLGGWVVSNPVMVPGYGVVSVSVGQEAAMTPEGDQVTGAMVFHSQARIYETEFDTASTPNAQHYSDIILWQNQKYRIVRVYPYPNRNYWRAIGVRMAGY